jgi:hypothetical protein
MSIVNISFVCKRAAPTLLQPSIEVGRIKVGDIAICHDGTLIAAQLDNKIYWRELQSDEATLTNRATKGKRSQHSAAN